MPYYSVRLTDRNSPPELDGASDGERIDVLTYVVTRAGFDAFWAKVGHLEPRVRVLTRRISWEHLQYVLGHGIEVRHLPRLHAKAVLFRDAGEGVVGSFNITEPSLTQNVEIEVRVHGEDLEDLGEMFDAHWDDSDDDFEFVGENIWLDDFAGSREIVNALRRSPPHPLVAFQEEVVREAMASLAEAAGARSLGRIVRLPTGAGKTVVAAEVIRRFLTENPDARVLWTVHRRELLCQAYLSLLRQLDESTRVWIPPNLRPLEDDLLLHPRPPPETQVVLAPQLRAARIARGVTGGFDLVVVDECHRYHPRSKSYRALQKVLGSSALLGLSATPLRREQRQFGTWWETDRQLGTQVTEADLTEKGILARLNDEASRAVPTGLRFRFEKAETGREREKELITRVGYFDHPAVNAAVHTEYQHLRGAMRRILLFGVSIAHVERLKTEHFKDEPSVRVLHSRLPAGQIRSTLAWFREEPHGVEPRMLLTVLLASEGVDLPLVDCLLMVRPTFSHVLRAQMLGRGFRGPLIGGTDSCAVLDFTYQFLGPDGSLVAQVLDKTPVSDSDQDWEDADDTDDTAESDDFADTPHDPEASDAPAATPPLATNFVAPPATDQDGVQPRDLEDEPDTPVESAEDLLEWYGILPEELRTIGDVARLIAAGRRHRIDPKEMLALVAAWAQRPPNEIERYLERQRWHVMLEKLTEVWRSDW